MVRTDRYTFYRIAVDSAVKSKLLLAVTPVNEDGHSDAPRGSDRAGAEETY